MKVVYKVVVNNSAVEHKFSMEFDGENTPKIVSLEKALPLFQLWAVAAMNCKYDLTGQEIMTLDDLEAAAVTGRKWYYVRDWLVDIYVSFE